MRPLVSILVPSYNAQEWIAETIQSALAQTWLRTEIIVVDDGSTDATLDIARQFESPKLKVIQQENSGSCCARNRALRESQGDYIQWLDADDLLASYKIERQITVAEELADPEVLFASAWGKFHFQPNREKFRSTPLWRDHAPVDWLVLRLANPWIMPISTWLVSRRLTNTAGPWDERLTRNQDGEYFCRLVSLCRYVKFVTNSHFHYRITNSSSVSKSMSPKSWESLSLSIDLETHHLLARENSERTRAACISRLSGAIAFLEAHTPNIFVLGSKN